MQHAAGPVGLDAAGHPSPGGAEPSPRAPESAPPALTEFFRHHGIWAPGVRLFRRMRFVAKASIVSAFFLIPLVTLSIAYFSEASAALAFSQKERVGVIYLRETALLLEAVQRQRVLLAQGAAPAVLAGLREQIAAQWLRLKAVDQQHAAGIEMRDALDAPMRAYQASTDAPQNAAAHAQFAATLLDVLDQVSDQSNLSLDPAIDTVYLMTNVTTNLPKIADALAHQAALAAATQAAGGTATVAQVRELDVIGAMATQSTERARNEFAKVYGLHPDYRAVFGDEEARASADAARQVDATSPAGLQAMAAKSLDAMRLLSALQAVATQRLDELLGERIRVTRLWRNATSVLIGSSVLLAAYLFYAFYLVTQGGLREVEKHLQAMTQGDLTTRPNPWGRDEAAGLMIALSQMQASLRGIVARVRGASTVIVLSSSEIAAASLDLSERTEQTATNLQQSATAVEQIASTAKQTATHSEHAAVAANENSAVASKGGSAIREAIATMQNIQESSTKIGDIIGTIDGIAFQTNILALNAAVEAARAGEHGRGFAVVAAEVRTLAQRSASAARQIKTLVANSMSCVESGSKIVGSAGETMALLVDTAQQTKHLLADISVAAVRQSQGVAQVGIAVNQLEAMTQQNAALVEQTAASASSLNQQALHLAGEVARFKLPG